MNSTPIQIGREILYPVEEVAEAYGVSEVTIRTLLRVGVIQGVKLDRRWFVTEAEFKRVRKAIPKLGTRGPKGQSRKRSAKQDAL